MNIHRCRQESIRHKANVLRLKNEERAINNKIAELTHSLDEMQKCIDEAERRSVESAWLVKLLESAQERRNWGDFPEELRESFPHANLY